MKFGISIEADWEAGIRIKAIQKVENKLSAFIESNDYGSGVKHLTIGLVVIKTKQGYEHWNKQRKPRFKKEQLVTMLDGTISKLENSYGYDIKLTDEEVEDFMSSDELALEVFFRRLIESLLNFESPSMRKRDFNLAKFRADIESFTDIWIKT